MYNADTTPIQRQSPRRYDIYFLNFGHIYNTFFHTYTSMINAYTIHLWSYNHTLGIYRCYVLDCNRKFARFRYVKNKASSKRLSYVWIPSFPPYAHNVYFILNK